MSGAALRRPDRPRRAAPALAGAALALLLASCAPQPTTPGFEGGEVVDGSTLPYNDAAGTRFAPAAAPPPPARGVAPAPSARTRFYPARVAETPSAVIGPVCGDPRIIGRTIAPIEGARPGCGVAAPVRVVSVSGVALSTPVRVNCGAATQLANWIARGVQPEAGRLFGARVASIRPVASYACRTRNSRPGARLSEHATGGAVDIASFTLEDGATLSVLEDWPATGVRGRFMRAVHKSACGPFGTVLGPQSDAFHRDHFHLDTARHRGGPYCR